MSFAPNLHHRAFELSCAAINAYWNDAAIPPFRRRVSKVVDAPPLKCRRWGVSNVWNLRTRTGGLALHFLPRNSRFIFLSLIRAARYLTIESSAKRVWPILSTGLPRVSKGLCLRAPVCPIKKGGYKIKWKRPLARVVRRKGVGGSNSSASATVRTGLSLTQRFFSGRRGFFAQLGPSASELNLGGLPSHYNISKISDLPVSHLGARASPSSHPQGSTYYFSRQVFHCQAS